MTHAAFHKLFLWLCFVFFTKAIAISEIGIPLLPAVESEAMHMLGEGTLDSSVWLKIVPFYTTPIRVAQGELRLLQDLFPELPDDLPCTSERLTAYLPWNDSTSRKFFYDFPELEPFRPILSFESGPAAALPMQAGFYFSRNGAADSARQYALFSIGSDERIVASGCIDFTDAYGRWFRRAISVVPVPGVRIACGNFSPRRRTPLISGHFPSTGNNNASISDNWLNGSARTWNGMAVTYSCQQRKQEYEALFHASRTEKIGQLSGTLECFQKFLCFGGISFVSTPDNGGQGKDHCYFLAGADFSPAHQWKCELQSNVNLENPMVLAWHATISHSADRSVFKGTFTGLPNKYIAPRSEMTGLLRTRANDDSVSGYLLNADLQFRHRLNDYITCTPSMNCLMNDNRPRYLMAGIELAGEAWCSYRLWYSWSPLLDETNIFSRQHIMAECIMPLSKKTELDCSGQLYCRSGDFWSNRLRISVPVKVNRALTLSPTFMIYGARTGLHEETAGIMQRLLLYKKTFSDITIEKELPFSSWRTIRVRGKMSFYF